MRSHYPMTASRPRCIQNYHSGAACLPHCRTQREKKSHGLASMLSSSGFFFGPVVAVIWVYWNALGLFLGLCWFVSRSLKFRAKPSDSEENEHPAGQCTPGYVNHADSRVKIDWSGVPGLQMTLICYWKLLKVAQFFDSWPEVEAAPCFGFVWPYRVHSLWSAAKPYRTNPFVPPYRWWTIYGKS